MNNFPRNPWTGINAWKEFKYDLRHPVQFNKRVWAGLRGRNPQVSKSHRYIGAAMVVVGACQFITGAVVLTIAAVS